VTNQWQLLNNFWQAFEELWFLQVVLLYKHVQVLQRYHTNVLKIWNLKTSTGTNLSLKLQTYAENLTDNTAHNNLTTTQQKTAWKIWQFGKNFLNCQQRILFVVVHASTIYHNVYDCFIHVVQLYFLFCLHLCCFFDDTTFVMRPADVVQWISHSDATCGRAWRVRLPLFGGSIRALVR